MMRDPPLSAPVHPLQILVVEDEPADVALWRYAFRDSGTSANIVFARDGVEALAAITSGQIFDLVVLDLNLPKVGGKEVLQAIRGHLRFDAVPVIVLSTARADAEVAECYRLGASRYIQKPTSYPELVTMARQLSDDVLSR